MFGRGFSADDEGLVGSRCLNEEAFHRGDGTFNKLQLVVDQAVEGHAFGLGGDVGLAWEWVAIKIPATSLFIKGRSQSDRQTAAP